MDNSILAVSSWRTKERFIFRTEVSYQLGYVGSATNGYCEKPEEHLKEALNIYRRQEADRPGEYVTEIAKVCDYLGFFMDDIVKECKKLLNLASRNNIV